MAVIEKIMASKAPDDRSGSVADAVLTMVEYWYVLVLLVVFFTLAATRSIVTAKARAGELSSTIKGPGGKPLPATKSKSPPVECHWGGPKFAPKEVLAFRILSALVTALFIASTCALISHAFVFEEPATWARDGIWWWCGESTLVYLFGVGFLYVYLLLTMFEWKETPTVAHLAAWSISFAAELTLAICSVVRASSCIHLPPHAEIPANPAERGDFCFGKWERLDLGLYVSRSCILLGMSILYGALWIANCRRRTTGVTPATHDAGHYSDMDEATPLLNGATKTYDDHDGIAAADINGADGNISDDNSAGSDDDEAGGACKEEQTGFYRQKKLPKKTWWEYISGYSIFFPYLWPKGKMGLQLVVISCFILLVCQRVVNILVPMQVGLVTQKLLDTTAGGDWQETFRSAKFPLKQLLVLGAYWGLQGSGGLLASFRSLLWIRVSQYSYRGLTTAAFEHVHSLSLDFHLGKRTGEVLSALNKGSSINQFLEQITFNVVPMLVDLLVAIYFFWYHFGPTFAALIGVNTFWYLYLTVRMAQTRAEQRREMTNADREEEAVKNDSITSYETVKYFNAEDYEFNRYRSAINDFQRAEAQVSRGTSRMSIVQALVYNGGRVLAATLGAWKVSNGTMTVGDFSALLAYLAQLQGPLNFFGTFYRQVQQAMISGERLLELFKIQPTVLDAPHVQTLRECSGRIRWSNVSFAYQNRNAALKNIDFECEPGTTTAFVGESGGGKSTLFRLMFRYYNTSKGRIELDGQDVKDLTIDSVRRFIGVVPQDTTLFNDTLMFNLRYANQNATDEDVYNACRAASIHDRIMSFPEKYQTKVGERGLRLSGGEKQRVAIARTILKNPKIIMLDEATSALDTNTEQQIQDQLGSLGFGRTLLIIAHRLSTITHADQIIVLHAGSVAEKGTHEELLAKKGRYAEMWDKQIRAERAAAEARVANRKAQKLMRQANIVADNDSDGRSDGYNSMTTSQILQGGHTKDGQKLGRDDDGDTSCSSSSSDAESTHNGRD